MPDVHSVLLAISSSLQSRSKTVHMHDSPAMASTPPLHARLSTYVRIRYARSEQLAMVQQKDDAAIVVDSLLQNLKNPATSLSQKYRILFSLRNLKGAESQAALIEGEEHRSHALRISICIHTIAHHPCITFFFCIGVIMIYRHCFIPNF
jgi:hypothetical protein